MLDTSAYSRFRAGETRVRDLIADAELVLLPAPVIVVDDTVARHYGRVYAGLRRAGTPIPANDMWIAACAIDRGACLVTFDHDFDHVAGLDRHVLDGIELGTDD